ncbi:MAG: ComEA family DNA-binding protein [Fibrobacteria bacterium]|nr:ComEA family DNA-binding protein [Fibrobacteria bacterium]
MESPRAPSSKTVAVPARINPNTATREQLIALPGVGPALAARILEARVKSPFRSLADLDRVKGIGPAKLETLRSHLTF